MTSPEFVSIENVSLLDEIPYRMPELSMSLISSEELAWMVSMVIPGTAFSGTVAEWDNISNWGIVSTIFVTLTSTRTVAFLPPPSLGEQTLSPRQLIPRNCIQKETTLWLSKQLVNCKKRISKKLKLSPPSSHTKPD